MKTEEQKWTSGRSYNLRMTIHHIQWMEQTKFLRPLEKEKALVTSQYHSGIKDLTPCNALDIDFATLTGKPFWQPKELWIWTRDVFRFSSRKDVMFHSFRRTVFSSLYVHGANISPSNSLNFGALSEDHIVLWDGPKRMSILGIAFEKWFLSF